MGMSISTNNIMLNHSKRITIIDIDSSWPITRLQTEEPKNDKVAAELWELWNNYINKRAPRKLVNAQKTVVLSFAAVWSRAIVLKHRPPQYDPHAALKLIVAQATMNNICS